MAKGAKSTPAPSSGRRKAGSGSAVRGAGMAKRPAPGQPKTAKAQDAVGTAKPPDDKTAGGKARARRPAKAQKPGAREAGREKGAPRSAATTKTSVVFSRSLYETHKEELKEPLRGHDLKWQYLGPGKGRYHKEGVHMFVQFLDDGVHYSVWGADATTIRAILGAWKATLGEQAWKTASVAAEAAEEHAVEEQVSEALRAWQFGEPQKQPGEPESFYQLRRKAWLARKPRD
ncbi:MAG: hypothetical protein ACYDDF_09105 [Thermoplasmatota archaeon]